MILGMPEEQYHADPCVTPSLSSSLAKVLIRKSAMHARHIHPRFGGHSTDPTDARDFGSLVHSLTLGGGSFEVLDVDAYTTKAARELRDNARAAGKIPIKRKEYDVASRVAEALGNRLNLRGKNEITLLWQTNTDDGVDVQCRSRIDNLDDVDGYAVITEVKTTAVGADERSLRKVIEDNDYHVQAASQMLAVERVCPGYVGRVKFRWAFVETSAPYGVRLAKPTGAMLAIGLSRWSRAVDIWARCMTTGEWPGYPTEEAMIEPSPWAMAEMEEANANV